MLSVVMLKITNIFCYSNHFSSSFSQFCWLFLLLFSYIIICRALHACVHEDAFCAAGLQERFACNLPISELMLVQGWACLLLLMNSVPFVFIAHQRAQAYTASYGQTRCGQRGRWMGPDVVTVDARGSLQWSSPFSCPCRKS